MKNSADMAKNTTTLPFRWLEELGKRPSAEVWHYFAELMQVPRESKHEEKMVAYLEEFAKAQQLDFQRDAVGNVLIKKSATNGRTDEVVVLQSHMDMVCVKGLDVKHDFRLDAIQGELKGNRLYAKGTTLGADDGIGVASQLAILASKTLKHSNLECLFTVDEETGLTGAMNLQKNFISGKTLINLDSEEEGEIYVGCAGGCSTNAYFAVNEEVTPEGMLGITLSIDGLQGGHSGSEIHLERGNALKLMARFVQQATDEVGFRMSKIEGGQVRNAIAQRCLVAGVVPMREKENLRVLLNIFVADVEEELGRVDPNFRFVLGTCDTPNTIYNSAFAQRLVDALVACPHGVLAMSKKLPDLVQTSVNLAVIHREGDEIVVCTSQRSSLEGQKNYAQKMVASTFRLAGARVEMNEGYPGWEPNFESEILRHATKVYEQLFSKRPEIKAIHAGLECGLFLEKYPDLDMISIGPTLLDVHTPRECIDVDSLDKFWAFLTEILK